jgi:hypothetical protein
MQPFTHRRIAERLMKKDPVEYATSMSLIKRYVASESRRMAHIGEQYVYGA